VGDLFQIKMVQNSQHLNRKVCKVLCIVLSSNMQNLFLTGQIFTELLICLLTTRLGIKLQIKMKLLLQLLYRFVKKEYSHCSNDRNLRNKWLHYCSHSATDLHVNNSQIITSEIESSEINITISVYNHICNY